MLRSRKIPALLALVYLVAACASSKGFIVSGEALDLAGKEFVATAQAMNLLLDQKKITVEQYRSWATFAERFKEVFPLAKDGWQAAVKANDQAKQNQLAAMITTLAGQVTQYAVFVASILKK